MERGKTIYHRISEFSKLAQKEYNTRQHGKGKVDPLGSVQLSEIWPNYQMIYTNQNLFKGMSGNKFSGILSYKTGPWANWQKKKKDLPLVDFLVSADYRMNIKEGEKIEWNMDFDRE